MFSRQSSINSPVMLGARQTGVWSRLLCASVAALALHSCASAPPKIMSADDLLSAPYSLAGAQPIDVDALFAALPEGVSVNYGAAAFDPALGAMVISDMALGFDTLPGFGMRAERALVWGADSLTLSALSQGGASAMAPLFERLVLEGVRSEGVQWQSGAQSASLRVEKIVIDGLSARSFALAEKPGAGQKMKSLRQLAAVMGAVAYDGAAFSHLSWRLANSQGDRISMSVGQSFVRGYDSGAVEYQSLRDMRSSISPGNILVEVSEKRGGFEKKDPFAKILNKPSRDVIKEAVKHPVALLASATGGRATQSEIDFIETHGADFARALTWLARWELPPITETELMAFGQSHATGMRESWNGRPVISVDAIDILAADFYWLVPSSYDVSYTGVKYNFGMLIDSMAEQMGPGMATEAGPQFEKMRGLVSAMGLDNLTADMAASWRWDGETGAAAFSTYLDAVDLAASGYGAELNGPSLVQWDAMARNETLIGAALEQFTLRRFDYTLTDQGMLERAFVYAAQEQGAGVEAGPQLRQTVSAMVRLAGVQGGQINPRISGYASAVADFLGQGGTIDLVAAPDAPVCVAQIMAAAGASPDTLPDLLNVAITHRAAETK